MYGRCNRFLENINEIGKSQKSPETRFSGDFSVMQQPNVEFVTYFYPGGEIVCKSV